MCLLTSRPNHLACHALACRAGFHFHFSSNIWLQKDDVFLLTESTFKPGDSRSKPNRKVQYLWAVGAVEGHSFVFLVTCWHQLWVEHLRLYLSSIKGRVFRLYTLRLGDEGEDHLRLQAQGQLLVVLLLGTVTWSLAVFVLCKQVCVSLHQKLRQAKTRKGEAGQIFSRDENKSSLVLTKTGIGQR